MWITAWAEKVCGWTMLWTNLLRLPVLKQSHYTATQLFCAQSSNLSTFKHQLCTYIVSKCINFHVAAIVNREQELHYRWNVFMVTMTFIAAEMGRSRHPRTTMHQNAQFKLKVWRCGKVGKISWAMMTMHSWLHDHLEKKGANSSWNQCHTVANWGNCTEIPRRRDFVRICFLRSPGVLCEDNYTQLQQPGIIPSADDAFNSNAQEKAENFSAKVPFCHE